MDQPHIQEAQTFDPIDGWARTFHWAMQLIGGLTQTPDAVPTAEIIRAASRSLDILDAISQMSHASMLAQFREVTTDKQAFDEFMMNFLTERTTRSPEETMQHHVNLLKEFGHVVAIELPHDDDPDD